MKTICSLSGGQSSAYVAANYPCDYLLFALVTIKDQKCSPKDKALVKYVEDKLGESFIATPEDDTIILTMMDLEQELGQKVNWVKGLSFEDVIEKKGGYLPNRTQRFCTVEMKLRPMHRWWRNNLGPDPIEMRIGFRKGEEERARRMHERCNSDGLIVMHDVIGKHNSGRNKWAEIPWQKPSFPMVDDRIGRDVVVEYWKKKSVRFAERNNCVGCFHRNPILLRTLFDKHPEKMNWFAEQETGARKARWMKEIRYHDIAKHKLQTELSFEDFSDCDSGHCGI